MTISATSKAAQLKARVTIFGLPVLGGCLIAVSASYGLFKWADLVCFLVFYLLTMFGLTAGYHRLFTHRSYEPTRALKVILAVLGAMAAQGPLLFWASVHRMHHRYSDKPGDPHSPHVCKSEHSADLCLYRDFGFFQSHVGWMLGGTGLINLRSVRDLASDSDVLFIDRNYSKWVILGLILPSVFGWFAWGSPVGLCQGFLYGGLLRMLAVQHAVWGVNSICHMYGYRNTSTEDESRNNFLFGALVLGDGFHNNHHARPGLPYHGWRWWEFDPTYDLLRALRFVGAVKVLRSRNDRVALL